MNHTFPIMITLDVEECDIPLDYGLQIDLAEQIEISRRGLVKFMQLMDELAIPVTIFCTGVYAQNNPEWIKQLNPRHELASHGFFHGHFDAQVDLKSSKLLLEQISGKEVTGFRMARMQQVDEFEIKKADYQYHSSLNPTWIPGRYDHRDQSKIPFFKHQLWNIPASVSPQLRVPLFWLAFKNFPLWLYKHLTKRTILRNKFLNIYFHPWEFTDLSAYKLPYYIRSVQNDALIDKLGQWIRWLKEKELGEFCTMSIYVNQLKDGK